jgi:hypothetical protein
LFCIASLRFQEFLQAAPRDTPKATDFNSPDFSFFTIPFNGSDRYAQNARDFGGEQEFV